MRRLIQSALFVLICFTLFLMCATPQNPMNLPENVTVLISDTDNSTVHLTGTMVSFAVSINNSKLVDSIKVSFGDGSPDSTIQIISENLDYTCSHSYTLNGEMNVIATAYIGSVIKNSPSLKITTCSTPILSNVQRSSILPLLDNQFILSVVAPVGSNLQWYKDGQIIPNAISDSLVFFHLIQSDTGKYWCTNSTLCGSIKSDTFSLFFLPPGADITKPVLSLLAPASGSTVTTSPALIRIKASDSSGIASVKVNGSTAILTNGNYEIGVTLIKGTNSLTVVAIDNSPASNSDSLVFTLKYDQTAVDSTAPVISLISHHDNQTVSVSNIKIVTSATDQNGIAWVKINDQNAVLNAGNFEGNVILQKGINTVKIIAQDNSLNNNLDTFQFTLNYDPSALDTAKPVTSLISHSNGQTVSTNTALIQATAIDENGISSVRINDTIAKLNNGKYECTMTLVKGTNAIVIIARDNSTNKNEDTLKVTLNYDPTAIDNSAPTIQITSHTNNQTVSVTPVTVRATVTDPNGISAVTINGKAATLQSGSYETLINLQNGNNQIKIIAVDNSTNKNKDSLSINLTYDPSATDNIAPQVNPTSHTPGQSVATANDTLKISATDANGIAWVTVNNQATVLKNGLFVIPITLVSGTNSFIIVAQDASLNKNKDTVTFQIKYDPTLNDHSGPIITVTDPTTDSSTISSSSKMVVIKAKDANSVSLLTVKMGSTTFSPTQANDSIWNVSITGLVANVFNVITISAKDGSANANATTKLLSIKYDPSLTDNVGPLISPVSLPTGGRVTTAVLNLAFNITDDNGINGASWTLNGTAMGNLTGSSQTYSITTNLTKYHSNVIVITAKDNSTNHNTNTYSLTLDYNTVLSGVSIVSPSNGATNVENLNTTIKWTKATDADADAIAYTLYYGTNSSNLVFTKQTTDTFVTFASGINPSTTYYWMVETKTNTDTIKSPTTGSWSFSTVNHPTSFSQKLVDKTIDMNASTTFIVSAADLDTIDHYEWSYGDGTANQNSTTGSMSHTYTTGGTYTVTVTVVDKYNAKTSNTATITVVDHPPTVSISGPSALVGLNDPIQLTGTFNDDGGTSNVKIEWNIDFWSNVLSEANYKVRSKIDTTFNSPSENLPDTFRCVVRVTDKAGNKTTATFKVKMNMIWKCASANAGFAGRAGLSSIYFNNKIWIFGGASATSPYTYSDVWQSDQDGTTWLNPTVTSSYTPRYWHGTTFFNGKVWIIGGNGVPDCYNTTDCLTWTKSAGFLFPTDKSIYRSVSFNSNLWIIGGTQSSSDSIYYSSTGTTWNSYKGNNYFGTRNYHSVVTFNNSLWLLGGMNDFGDKLNDVWSSTDGKNWTQISTSQPFSARGLHSTVASDTYIWVIGGSTLNGDSNDVWYSKDGTSWKCASKSVAFPKRHDQTSLVTPNGKIWVIGGVGTANTYYNDVWYTDDTP